MLLINYIKKYKNINCAIHLNKFEKKNTKFKCLDI